MKYKKQILRFGKWKHANAPGGVLEITKDYGKKLINNFKRSPFSPVLRGHNEDEAEKNPDLIVTKNIDGLKLEDDGVYAEFDMDKKELDKYNDVSVGINSNYTDKETGSFLGPVLRHIALVTNPYIKGLKTFTQLSEEKGLFNILLSEINMEKDKNLNLEDTKEDTKVDAEETKSEDAENADAGKGEDADAEGTDPKKNADAGDSEEPKKGTEEEAGDAKEGEDVETSEGLKAKMLELEEKIAKQEHVIKLKDAETKFNDLLNAGKITPAQKDAFIELSTVNTGMIELSDGKTVSELVTELIEKGPQLVEFGERGIDVETGNNKTVNLSENEMASLMKRNNFTTREQALEYIEKNADVFEKHLNN